jgi:hypothetical protein
MQAAFSTWWPRQRLGGGDMHYPDGLRRQSQEKTDTR